MICLKKFYISNISTKYLNWLRDEQNTKYTTINNKISKREVLKYIIRNKLDPNSSLFRIMYNKSHVGNLRIININKKTASIGILVGEKKFHSKGIGTRAIKLAIKILRNKNIYKIIAIIDPRNIGSIKAFKRNGFRLSKSNKKKYVLLLLN